MTFENYLQQRNLSPKTIATYQRYTHIFFNWINQKSLLAVEISYTDLLDFIKDSRGKGLTPDYLMKILGTIRHYYNYLKFTNQINVNPANGLYIKGKQKRIPHDLLTAEQLETIYTEFNQSGISGKRNKIMLGLMIYQGITTSELQQLEPDHLKLREGKITIPKTRRSHRRTLKLEAHQMIDLQEYVSKTRELILTISERESPKLFVSTGTSETLRGSLDKLMTNLRKKHEYFTNAQQIRQSRLAIWVKQYDIRQAQYLAGHKYVSSTERYQSADLEDLQKELDKHHPSGN